MYITNSSAQLDKVGRPRPYMAPTYISIDAKAAT